MVTSQTCSKFSGVEHDASEHRPTQNNRPVIPGNGYNAHPENMSLCMLSDERKHIRPPTTFEGKVRTEGC
ncbi:hypothetical protein J6590_086150, partial [Homalodisca vitripennis]